MNANIWYCGSCRKVIKSDPPLLPRTCHCAMPSMHGATKVTWDRET